MEKARGPAAGDPGSPPAAESSPPAAESRAIVPLPGVLSGAILRPGAGISSDDLRAVLPALQPGDPLGLGINPAERPPAPPDPDVYDRERENAEFARSILTEQERKAADADVAKGFMTIAQVRDLVAGNTVKGDMLGLDPEIMMLIDARIDYKIFVASDNVYTREELYASFPFHELNVQPEAIFMQQEIGVFPPRKYSLRESELEYVARDVGDASVEFVMIEDLVGQVARTGYTAKRAPLKIAKTKVYIGKEQWEDFSLLQRVFRGITRVAHAQLAYCAKNGGQPAVPLLAMFGARPSPEERRASETPLLVDRETLEAEKREQAQREAELRKREEDQWRRAEEQRKALEEAQRKIDADLKRIEEMLAAASQMKNDASPRGGAEGAGPSADPGPDNDDSVAI